ncbi:hypothetical protein [Laspinema palackyanum]|uniref:hypothetical protein n=1 Tax=Laspinema palackyanum TaxID=3231601 RepID=UPI00345CEDD9|nr:hypothetical protein [Laspinema sp. D2c]
MSLEISEEYISLEEWARIVAYAWTNETFKNEFELHPRKAIEDFLNSHNVEDENNATRLGIIELFQKVRFKRFFEIPPCPTAMKETEINDILSGKQTHVIPYLTI